MSFKTKQKLNAILIFSLNEFRFFPSSNFSSRYTTKKSFLNTHHAFFSNLLLKTQLFGLFSSILIDQRELAAINYYLNVSGVRFE